MRPASRVGLEAAADSGGLEPKETYAAVSGDIVGIGLYAVVWSSCDSPFGESPWLGLTLRVEP